MRLLLWMLVLYGCVARGVVHGSSGESSKSGNAAILRHITKGKPSKESPYRQAYVAQRQEKKRNHNVATEARKVDLKVAQRGPKADKMDIPENRDAQQVREGDVWRSKTNETPVALLIVSGHRCQHRSASRRLAASPPSRNHNPTRPLRAAERVGAVAIGAPRSTHCCVQTS